MEFSGLDSENSVRYKQANNGGGGLMSFYFL